ncbi:hypothetical protein [Paraburkholderia ferrariae]|uniref:hypothetical protein n=1 Tax=Paraburkholderia ferrariae TaxID=386056 RepID=UPI0004807518|nr:hypothetical protein [Paraburkholderia ferrariae]
MTLAGRRVALNQVMATQAVRGHERLGAREFARTDRFYGAAYAMFVLCHAERRLPRYELAPWAVVLVGALAMLLVPRLIAETRDILAIGHACNFFVTSGAFMWFAARRRRTDRRIAAVSVAVFFAAGLRDLPTFVGVLDMPLMPDAETPAAVAVEGVARSAGPALGCGCRPRDTTGGSTLSARLPGPRATMLPTLRGKPPVTYAKKT